MFIQRVFQDYMHDRIHSCASVLLRMSGWNFPLLGDAARSEPSRFGLLAQDHARGRSASTPPRFTNAGVGAAAVGLAADQDEVAFIDLGALPPK